MEARGLSGLALVLALALPLARHAVLGLVSHLAACPARPKLTLLALIVGFVGGLGVLRVVVVVVGSVLCAEGSLSVT